MKTTKDKIEALKKHHAKTFKALGIENPHFCPKMAYVPTGKREKCVTFFTMEIEAEKDVYTEFVSREYKPEDPERRLWKWKYNPHFKDEYETTATEPVRYIIPINELELINTEEVTNEVGKLRTKTTSVKKEVNTISEIESLIKEDSITDIPISQLTVRDLISIIHLTPLSNKGSINELVLLTKLSKKQ
jgi:hypothetical protein